MARLTIPTTEGDAPVRPSFMLQLSYEWQIRERAFEMVREENTTLVNALKLARADPELRSLRFTTPLTLEGAKRKQDQVSLWRPPNKFPKGEGKAGGKDKGKKGKGKGKGDGKNDNSKGGKGKGKMNTWNGIQICYQFNNKVPHDGPCARAHVCQMAACNGAKHPLADCPIYQQMSNR